MSWSNNVAWVAAPLRIAGVQHLENGDVVEGELVVVEGGDGGVAVSRLPLTPPKVVTAYQSLLIALGMACNATLRNAQSFESLPLDHKHRPTE